jgi:hypothetical protein
MNRETLALAAEVISVGMGRQRLKPNQNTARFGTVEQAAEKSSKPTRDVIPNDRRLRRAEEPAFLSAHRCEACSSLRFGMTPVLIFSATCETVPLRHYQRPHADS